jgi:hypothetical protein
MLLDWLLDAGQWHDCFLFLQNIEALISRCQAELARFIPRFRVTVSHNLWASQHPGMYSADPTYCSVKSKYSVVPSSPLYILVRCAAAFISK